jgi:hypothetical protein
MNSRAIQSARTLPCNQSTCSLYSNGVQTNICAPLHRKGLYLNKVCVQNGFTLQAHGSLAKKDKVLKFNNMIYDVSIAARIFQSHRTGIWQSGLVLRQRHAVF